MSKPESIFIPTSAYRVLFGLPDNYDKGQEFIRTLETRHGDARVCPFYRAYDGTLASVGSPEWRIVQAELERRKKQAGRDPALRNAVWDMVGWEVAKLMLVAQVEERVCAGMKK